MQLSLKEYLLTGRLGRIERGLSRENVIDLLGQPLDFGKTRNSEQIEDSPSFSYSGFDLFFEEHALETITVQAPRTDENSMLEWVESPFNRDSLLLANSPWPGEKGCITQQEFLDWLNENGIAYVRWTADIVFATTPANVAVTRRAGDDWIPVGNTGDFEVHRSEHKVVSTIVSSAKVCEKVEKDEIWYAERKAIKASR